MESKLHNLAHKTPARRHLRCGRTPLHQHRCFLRHRLTEHTIGWITSSFISTVYGAVEAIQIIHFFQPTRALPTLQLSQTHRLRSASDGLRTRFPYSSWLPSTGSLPTRDWNEEVVGKSRTICILRITAIQHQSYRRRFLQEWVWRNQHFDRNEEWSTSRFWSSKKYVRIVNASSCMGPTLPAPL